MTNTKEFSYTIEKHFGTVSVAGSLPLELNLVSFAGAPARYDLRKAGQGERRAHHAEGVT